MKLDWTAFGSVFHVSFGTAVGVVVLYAIGVATLHSGQTATTGPSRGPRPVQLVSGLCFAACAAVVLYGLYLIVNE